MGFEFATSSRIIFGEGKRKEVIPLVKTLGKRVFIVTGANISRVDWLVEELRRMERECELFPIRGEPSIQAVASGTLKARAFEAEVVIGAGGGSAIDAGKAIAALITNREPLLHYLEIIGPAKPLLEKAVPFIAIPTTAGTGAEVTRNAVLSSPEHRLKVSLRSALMLPLAAIVDPELTYSLPASVTAYSGMDALTQLIEPFLCSRANPITDALCREAIPRAAGALAELQRNPQNIDARRDMALASLFGGMALSNSGLGAVHAFASPIGGIFEAPHGAICAALLPNSLRVTLRALECRGDSAAILERFSEVAMLVTKGSSEKPADAIEWVADVCRELDIPRLSHWGVQPEHVQTLCGRAAQANSMKAHPVELHPEELGNILSSSL